MSHIFHPSILREYDIRGIVPETLGAEDAYWIGLSFAQAIKEDTPAPKIAVGYDGRLSSKALESALVKGLSDGGAEAVCVGLGPTPMLYFAVCTQHLDGGIMVTGSHNPPTHNGFKFMRGKKPFFGKDIKRLGEIAAQLAVGSEQNAVGRVRELTVASEYLKTLISALTGPKKLSVAWDAGNGAAGEIMAALCKALPGAHYPLYAQIDGTFPNHHPDPAEEKNLRDLKKIVLEKQCDVGIAFDGDGDRIGVIDDTGEVIWGDQLIAIYAADIAPRYQGKLIIADVKASQSLFDEIVRLGAVPLMWKTGHSHIKNKMLETGAPLAGEMSGHMFFADGYYGYDDGIYAAMRLLDILSRTDKKLSEFRADFPKSVATPEIRFPCEDDKKFDVVEQVKMALSHDQAIFSDVDGVRVTTEDGWWLLRASNTQPILVARAESKTQKGCGQLLESLKKYLHAVGIEL